MIATIDSKEEEGSCGLGSYRPQWLQRFNSTKWFLTVYGLLGTLQSMTLIYWVATLTTFEKRFRIPSKTTGLMLSGNEVSQILLSLLLTYYSGQRNRPLWIAWGVAISAASCFVLALPHFLYGPGEAALSLTKEHIPSHGVNTTLLEIKEKAGLCLGQRENEHCEKKLGGEYSKLPALLVFLSQFILGIGTTLYYALGQTYIDDNAKKTNTPLLLGVTMSLRTLGPAFGFLIGSACLSVFIEPSLTPVIDKRDPRWLGAWWLGWLVFGVVMFMFAILIALFPKNIKNPAAATKRGGGAGTAAVDSGLYKGVEIRTETKGGQLVKYSNSKMALKLPHPENKPPTLKGPIALLSVVSGFMVSGVLITKFKPGPRYLLGWNVIVGFIFIFGELSYTSLSCTDNAMVGYNIQNNSVVLGNECNKDCGCDYLKYSPVCLDEYKLTFYSACHAGCSSMKKENGLMHYYNCSCIPAFNVTSSTGSDLPEYFTYTGELKSGPCQLDCNYNFYFFFFVTFIIHFFGATGKIGNILVNYRAVKPEDKAFAQGLSLLLISLMAFIPGPILYGAIIDSTCLVWDETCGSKGNCWFYDKDTFRYALNGTAAAITVIGVVLDILVCYMGRDLDLYCEETEGPAKPKPKQKKYTAESDNEEGPLKFSYLPNSD